MYKEESYLTKRLDNVGIVTEARRFCESLPLDYSVNLRVGLDDNSFCCRVGLQQVLASDKRETMSSPTQWEVHLANLLP